MLTTGHLLASFNHLPERLMNRDDELAQFIRAARLKKGLSRIEAVNELTKAGVKVSYGYLNKLELGDRSLASANVELREGLRRLYGFSRSEWTAKTGLYTPDPSIYADEVHLETANIYNEGRRRIPVYDLVSAGPGSDGGVVVAYVDIGPEFVGDHHAYRVSGDSMKTEIEDNDVIIVKAQDYAAIRNDVVCWTPNDGMLCKRLSSIDSENGLYVLTSINPEYGAIVTKEIRIYGIVVEVRKRRKIYNGTH